MDNTTILTCARCGHQSSSLFFVGSYCRECAIDNYDACRFAASSILLSSDEWAARDHDGEGAISVLQLAPSTRARLAEWRHALAAEFYAREKQLSREAGPTSAALRDFRSSRQGLIWESRIGA